MKRWGWWLLFVLPVALACAGLRPAPTAAAGMALLRVVQASSDAPAVDVYLDGVKTATAMGFASTTQYAAVPASPHRLQVQRANVGGTLLDLPVDFKEGQAYTVVVADRLANMDGLVLNDTLAAPAPGKAAVRLLHASPDAPHVADVAVTGGPVVARNLPFKGSTDYLAVDPGTYRFDVRPAGATLALATTPPITLEAGRSYTVFVMGLLGDNTFRAVIAPDNAREGGVGGAPTTGGGALAAPAGRAPLPAVAALAALPLVAAAARRRLARAAAR